MGANKKTARIAGLLYLVIVCLGMFYLRYVPSQLTVQGNIAATMGNISAHETLFRLGILAEIIADVVFLLLSLVLYQLLHKVNNIPALLMVLFVAFSVLISFIALQGKFGVLTLTDKADLLKAFTPDQLKAQALIYLDLYRDGIIYGQIFWGLWLFPLGYLVYRSNMLPKVLGILLIAGCFGYLINFTGLFFFPDYKDTSIPAYITLPASIGELCICLWLLVLGVKEKQVG